MRIIMEGEVHTSKMGLLFYLMKGMFKFLAFVAAWVLLVIGIAKIYVYLR